MLHNAAFAALDLDWTYLAFDVPATELPAAMGGVRALGIDGLSVTMPHKTTIVALLDHLSSTARALGAVNTVVRQGSELIGHNTDAPGFLDALRLDEGFEPAGRKCLVVGAGGAGRAVAYALGQAGASEVAVLSRREAQAEAAAALAGGAGRIVTDAGADAASADLVVNATPLGMSPGDDLPIDPDQLGPGQLVVDLIYHPPATPLLLALRERGVSSANGLGMLIHQAAHAFRLWTGEEAPPGVLSASALAFLRHAS